MIPISRSSEYAIRALTHLAKRQDEGFCLAREMAEVLGIPAPFLGKCLQPLVARGILSSQRGRNGGFKLARPAARISLYDIVDSQEHLGRTRQCFLGQAECTDERACPMHDFWQHSSNEFIDRLARTSLADIIRFCEDKPASGYPAPMAD